MMDANDLANRFEYHPPTTEVRVNGHTSVRNNIFNVAQFLNGLLPDGREKSSAISKLEEAMFWANAALARQDDPQD